MIVTIDGPVASGKSSIAQTLARELGVYYLNTGMLYRALAYTLLERYRYSLAQLAQAFPPDVAAILSHIRYRYIPDEGAIIFFDDRDITAALKSSDVDQGASIVSSNESVRAALLAYQRAFSEHYDVVCDGRDCGSVIFPKAEFKFFLTADRHVRADRWRHAQAARGKKFSQDQALALIDERDQRDSLRSVAPLTVSADSYVFDNSAYNQAQTVAYFLSIIHGS